MGLLHIPLMLARAVPSALHPRSRVHWRVWWASYRVAAAVFWFQVMLRLTIWHARKPTRLRTALYRFADKVLP